MSEGSQMLLLTPYKKIIGTIVIPVLGAVPEGCMVLFSGLSGETASIGVGTLAGSSIMLLTVNWTFLIFSGRVDSDNGVLQYESREKLTRQWDLINTGCENTKEVKKGSWKLILSIVPLVIIELGCIGTDLRVGASMKDLYYAKIASIVMIIILFISYC